jgi:FXSXX-COOH protein
MDDNEVGPEETDSGLADVTRMALPELLPSDDSVLANSLRRLLADLDRPQEVISAFGNYASGPDPTELLATPPDDEPAPDAEPPR